MPRSLTTRPYRVALSGKTADGRTISAEDLRDMADAYSREVYTACIWIEHDRWWNTAGTVYGLEARTEDNGKVGLYAQLRPNETLLYLNDRGEKLFTSIEITPDFAGTGQAYLTGLAVTDSPASLGTEELYFSKRASRIGGGQALYFSSGEVFPQFTKQQLSTPTDEQHALRNFFSRLFNFGSQIPTPQETKEMVKNFTLDPDSLAILVAFREQILAIGAAMTEVIDSANADPTPQTQEVTDAVATTEDAAAVVVEDAKEKEGELSKQTKAMAESIFNQVMAKVANEPVNTQQFKVTSPVADVVKKRIL